MTPLRQRILEDMQMRGLAERTQESYLGAVSAPIAVPPVLGYNWVISLA